MIETAFTVVMAFSTLLVGQNPEFFEKAMQQMAQGAEWHYVGVSPLDPTAEAIPGQICDTETGECGEPYILWKLKMPKDKKDN
jgi:hypothetical protein|tara:strand:+ start:1039 stop:1287 length:249 start_codon:yes stop_codon:yes gene_type:complete